MTSLVLSIGIPVHNEEQNIGKLLQALSLQKLGQNQDLEIITILDGCTDKSKEIIESVIKSNPNIGSKIKLIENESRIGKPKTLNKIKKNASGKYLLLLDADVLPAGTDFLNNLLIEAENFDLVACRVNPVLSSSLFSKIVNFGHVWKYKMFESLYPKNGVYLCHGRSLLMSSKLFLSFEYPHDVLADDAYAYFECLKQGLKFKYSEKISVCFTSPSTFGDYVNQNLRFSKSYFQCLRDFGFELVDREYAIPLKTKLRFLFTSAISNPFLFVTSFLVYVAAVLVNKFKKLDLNPQLYKTAKSTKEIL